MAKSPYGYDPKFTDFYGTAWRDMTVVADNSGKAIASAYAHLIGFTNDGEIIPQLQLTAE